MPDRYYFNRDRSRPYEEEYDEDFYERGYRSRGPYSREYEGDFDYGRGTRAQGRSFSDEGRFGRMTGGYGRYDRFGSQDRGYGGSVMGGYGSDYDYDEGIDRRGRGYYGEEYGSGTGRGYGPRGRSYDRGYDRDFRYSSDFRRGGDRDYGYNLEDERGYRRSDVRGYGSGMHNRGYGFQGGYDRDFGRGYDRGSYGRTGGYGFQPGYGSSFDYDYDFDTDFDYEDDPAPTTWTYQEIWLIPGPFSGVGPESYQRSDERIKEEICERLTRHGRLNARHIQVEVDTGEVKLAGTVDNRQAKRMAEDVIETISGVKDVQNELRVQERQQQGKEKEQQKLGAEHEKTQDQEQQSFRKQSSQEG